MWSFKCVKTQHKDLIQKIVYSLCGRRLAAYSLEGKVTVWNLSGTQSWINVASWQCEPNSILSINWASPEFGQLIVISFMSGKVSIWKESNDENLNHSTQQSSLIEKQKNGHASRTWSVVATFTESSEPVYCAKFAQCNHGLNLATASGDGTVRIYEANNTLDMSKWYFVEQIDMNEVSGGKGVKCLSWNTSIFDQPSFVVSFLNCNKALVWGFEESKYKWAVKCELIVDGDESVIKQVAWAPFMGNSYHYIASANGKNGAKIWKLKYENGSGFFVDKFFIYNKNATVIGIDWNMTGTSLAMFEDGRIISIWETMTGDDWFCTDTIKSAAVDKNITSV